jgi:hypothetical protein
MTSGPADAGDDLERLMADLKAKGWASGQLDALSDRWEDICHDPMRRGRGGKGLPQNERPPGEETDDAGPPSGVPRPDLAALLNRTATWKTQPGSKSN